MYIVERKTLKIYATLKTEQTIGIFRRPGDEFLYDDQMFSNIYKEKDYKVPVIEENKEI